MPNFKSKNEGTWFDFDERDSKIGGVSLRTLSPAEEEKIQAITVKRTSKPNRGMMVEKVDVNTALRNELMYDYWIMDWKNVELDGKSLECIKENKVKMMQVTDFAKFVYESLLDLSEVNKTIDEARVKNLESISSGSSTTSLAKDV